jgi:hypothetical protein
VTCSSSRFSEATTLSDVNNIVIQLQRMPGHNYFNKCHYSFLALGRHNADCTPVVASPGHIFYITPYTTKLISGIGGGMKIYDLLEKSVQRSEEKKALPENADDTLDRTARRLGCSLLRYLTNFTEVGATTACLWLLKGDITYSSHEFSSLNVHNAINDQLGRPTTTMLLNSNNITDHQTDSLDSDLDLRQQFQMFIDEQEENEDETSTINQDNLDSESIFDADTDSGVSDSESLSMDYEVASVFNSRLRDVFEPCTREYHVKWTDGSTSWEPRDCFVDSSNGTICDALIQFELSRTKEEHKHALVDTLRVDYNYSPSDVHTVKKHGDGVSTITTNENDTLNSIAKLFTGNDTITPVSLLEMNVWYFSSQLSDNRFHVGNPDVGLKVNSKLRRNTVLRLPIVASSHHFSNGVLGESSKFATSVLVDFSIDYRHRNYCNRKATPETNNEVKHICLYFAVSSFERKRGIPSDKCIQKGTAVTFTHQHPMFNTHYWKRRTVPTIPLLMGPRLQSITKLGVSEVL